MLNNSPNLSTQLNVLCTQLAGDNEPLKIDEASLTGESMAVNKKTGDTVLSGAVVEQGESEALVTAVGENTFFGKTIKLLSRPEEKGHLQQVPSSPSQNRLPFLTTPKKETTTNSADT